MFALAVLILIFAELETGEEEEYTLSTLLYVFVLISSPVSL